MIGPKVRLCIALLLAAALLVLAAAAWAGEPTLQLKSAVDKVLTVLRNPELRKKENKEERRKKIREVVESEFDFAAMARSALAVHWEKRSPAERKEFVQLFSILIERTYIGKIELYTDETIRYANERLENGFATVDTFIATKKGQEILIRYSMLKSGNDWKVYDVTIEGNRLVKNYRDQFQSIIRRSSYEDLVKTLRAKRDEG
ncbi:MAG: ABC transporter substrate-binding protein [Candidatus Tectomicrobia bacterium]|nr:ABC transporter substrate-binding protein [Candidatus Tectomicrobia bacterium]